MITFTSDFTVKEIRDAVVVWSESLAAGRYGDALEMFEISTESFPIVWSPELFEEWVCNYGMLRADYDDGTHHRVTSLFDLPNPSTYIDAIRVERTFEGRDPNRYVGWVEYDDVPLDGQPSDLTARFFIIKMPDGRITLEFLDIRVM